MIIHLRKSGPSGVVLRILQLVAIGGRGGTGASVVGLARALVRAGHEVWVGCWSHSQVARALGKERGIRLVTDLNLSAGFRPFKIAADLIRLVGLVRKERITVVHSHSSPDTKLALLLKLIFPGLKFVRTRHVPVAIKDSLQCSFADAIVAVSHAVKRDMGIRCSSKAKVVYDAFCGSVGSPRKEREFVVRNVSRYSRVKGLEFFLLALAELNRLISFSADVVGRMAVDENPYYVKLKALRRDLGLEGVLDLKGFAEDIDYLYGADVLALTSVSSEGSSRVAIEATLYGVPLVFHKVGAVGEICRHAKTGFGVDPGDVERMAFYLLSLWRYPVLKKKMSVNAKTMAENFSCERLVRDYQRVYGYEG